MQANVPTTPTEIDAGGMTIQVKDNQVTASYTRELEPEHKPVGPTLRMQQKINAELERGRQAIADFEERSRLNPPLPKSEAELRAEGSSTPVFRPEDFEEYKQDFATPGQTQSKDQGGRAAIFKAQRNQG